MPIKRSITVWMNTPSPYQNELFQALAATENVTVKVVFSRKIPSDRLHLGWEDNPRGYSFQFLGHWAFVKALAIAFRSRRDVHIVNGLLAVPSFALVLVLLRILNATFLIYSEAPNSSINRTWMKVKARGFFGNWIAKSANCGVLAVSHFARDFYESLRFSENQVYDFGYFRMSPQKKTAPNEDVFTVIYVGQLIQRKGIDLLVAAVITLFEQFQSLRLLIVGDGEDRRVLEKMLEKSGYSSRVKMLGALQSNEILDQVASADVLVLPSHWDGWGVVVNEALSVGTPIIVSNQCGAADLVKSGTNGFVFAAGNNDELRYCILAMLNQTKEQKSDMRQSAWITGQNIDARIAARYLIDCVIHLSEQNRVKPIPKWKTTNATLLYR